MRASAIRATASFMMVMLAALTIAGVWCAATCAAREHQYTVSGARDAHCDHEGDGDQRTVGERGRYECRAITMSDSARVQIPNLPLGPATAVSLPEFALRPFATGAAHSRPALGRSIDPPGTRLPLRI